MSKYRDYNPNKIDPEILPIIDRFNDADYKTQFSCQGHCSLSTIEGSECSPLSMTIPYILFDELYIPDIMKMIEGINELKLKTIKLEYSVYFKNNEDPCFEDRKTVGSYRSALSWSDKASSYFAVELSINPILLQFNEDIEDRIKGFMFDRARKKFLHELDLLSMYLLLRREKYDKD